MTLKPSEQENTERGIQMTFDSWQKRSTKSGKIEQHSTAQHSVWRQSVSQRMGRNGTVLSVE